MPLLQIPKWDKEADVIVVGAGTAGLPAAITAAEKGAETIILEAWSGSASSLAIIAGGTFFAGFDMQKEMGIDDSPDKLYEEAVEITGGDTDLWRALVDRQLEVYGWLKGIGARAQSVSLAPGHRLARTVRWEGHGAGVLKILRDTATKRGIKTFVKHRAERLIVDPATGRVIGVRAQHEDKYVNFRGRKAVVLATGGFIRNKELLQEFGPTFAGCIPVAPPTHRGDGLKMAMEVGGATAGIGLAVCPSISVCTTTGRTTVLPVMGAIAVDKAGKRWADEAGTDVGTYNIMFKEIVLKYPPDGYHVIIYDKKIRDAAPSEHYLPVKEYTADTIEELAKVVDIKPKALKATIDEYNSDIDKYGYDKKFGKRSWGTIPDKWQLPPPKVDAPPFYAVKCKVSLSSLKGGLKINPRAQVVSQFGDVIPGLYAAGELTGGLVSKPEVYYCATMTAMSFVFGRIAGENAAAEISR